MDDNYKKIENPLQIDVGSLNNIRPDFSKALRPTYEQAQSISRQMTLQREKEEKREQDKLAAAKKTADNTEKINKKLKSLEQIVDNQKELIAYQRQQLDVLRMLFASGEDGVAVQKEIMQHIIDAENNEHPVRDYIADKGGDVGVAALTASAPVIWAGIKTWLASRGVFFP